MEVFVADIFVIWVFMQFRKNLVENESFHISHRTKGQSRNHANLLGASLARFSHTHFYHPFVT